MRCHQHASNNMMLGANNIPNCETVPATMLIQADGACHVLTFWRPSGEELAKLNQGYSVCLHVMGNLHPPVAITVEGP